jgi:hypothetical protein
MFYEDHDQLEGQLSMPFVENVRNKSPVKDDRLTRRWKLTSDFKMVYESDNSLVAETMDNSISNFS